MHYVHNLSPIALELGPVAIRWYGLMYLLGFALFLVLGKLRAKEPWREMSARDVDDLLFMRLKKRRSGSTCSYSGMYS